MELYIRRFFFLTACLAFVFTSWGNGISASSSLSTYPKQNQDTSTRQMPTKDPIRITPKVKTAAKAKPIKANKKLSNKKATPTKKTVQKRNNKVSIKKVQKLNTSTKLNYDKNQSHSL